MCGDGGSRHPCTLGAAMLSLSPRLQVNGQKLCFDEAMAFHHGLIEGEAPNVSNELRTRAIYQGIFGGYSACTLSSTPPKPTAQRPADAHGASAADATSDAASREWLAKVSQTDTPREHEHAAPPK